jgi:TonB family protein
MKKIIAIVFTLIFVFTSFAGNGIAENPKTINYEEVLKGIEYPQVCREKGIEGRVIVLLSINKLGEITDYNFEAFPCSDLKEAVEDALPNMSFKPAINEQGQAVDGQLALPVNFKLTL